MSATANDEDRYVVPNKERGGCAVVKEGHERASAHFDTQAGAIARVREIVENSGAGRGEVRIQGTDGRFRDSVDLAQFLGARAGRYNREWVKPSSS